MKTDWILYFGYGSLVNRDTRPAQEVAHAARLKGWRRVWDHRVMDPNRNKPCTSLSIEPCQGNAVNEPTGIEGVVVRLPLNLLHQLDEREAGYERLSLPVSDFELPTHLAEELAGPTGTDKVLVYRSLERHRALADDDHPVLQSYIDCVMAGFLHRYGEAGVADFVCSTRGWDRAVCNDRLDPFYPRWVPVDEINQALFDTAVVHHVSKLHAACDMAVRLR